MTVALRPGLTGPIRASGLATSPPRSPFTIVTPPVPGTVAGGASTSTTVDVSMMPFYETTFIWGIVADAQPASLSAPAGWALLAGGSEGVTGGSSTWSGLWARVRQPGDAGTVTFNWQFSSKSQFQGFCYPGWNVVDKVGWSAHTAGTTYPSVSLTPSTETCIAVYCAGTRGTTAQGSFTPDPALVEFSDYSTTSIAWVGIEIADSCARVTKAAHSYTATCTQSNSHGGQVLLLLREGPPDPPVVGWQPPTLQRPGRKPGRPFTVQPLGDTTIAASGPAPAQVPPSMARAAARLPRPQRRPRVASPVPPQAAPVVPVWIPVRVGRGRLAALFRRGIRGDLTPPLEQAAAPRPARAGRRLQVRRPASSAGPVPAQAVVAPPAYPPRSVTVRRLVLGWRRGRDVAVVPAQVVVTPPAYPPRSTTARRLIAAVRRGRAAVPVQTQTAPVPPVWVPQGPRVRRLLGLLRRGRASAPNLVQQAPLPPPWPPQAVRARRAGWLSRRGARGDTAPPVEQARPPLTVPEHRPPEPARARRRTASSPPVPPPQIPPAPVRQPARRHNRPAGLISRARAAVGRLVPPLPTYGQSETGSSSAPAATTATDTAAAGATGSAAAPGSATQTGQAPSSQTGG